MIAVPENGDLVLITQGDHAHLAAEILSLCRFPALLEHPRRRQLLAATREHDNGWREVDAAPTLEPASGLPHTFLTAPDGVRREIWTRGCHRFRDRDSYLALLITQHAMALHSELARDPAWREWLDRIGELRVDLLEETGLDAPTLEADYSFLRFADLCALAACGQQAEFETLHVRGRFSNDTLWLDPLPLVGATSFQVSYRRLPRRRYSSSVEFGTELANARWARRSVRLRGDSG